jgi:NifU-like protein involved in Fe-S cluster formation
MSSARGLYTPDILAAAMHLTAYPWNEKFDLRGTARSRSCGSAIEIGLAVDRGGHVSAVGLKPHACAVGQAAASIFAKNVVGLDRNDLVKARQALALWLADEAEEPAWPGIALLKPARAYPARHGAILLAWDAALDAMCALQGDK